MKALFLLSALTATLALLGCANSRCASCSLCERTNRGTATYDPTHDVTRVSNEGHTWYLKGNQTNVVIHPTE